MSTSANPLPILVIEDEPSVMAYICTALTRTGYNVACAPSGGKAIEMLDGGSFLGVISDMRMPGDVDGADIYDWLFEHDPNLASRLFFITGDTMNPDTAAALERTGVPYIEKPFRVEPLIELVKKVIGVAG